MYHDSQVVKLEAHTKLTRLLISVIHDRDHELSVKVGGGGCSLKGGVLVQGYQEHIRTGVGHSYALLPYMAPIYITQQFLDSSYGQCSQQ